MSSRIYILTIAAILAASALVFGCHGDNSLPVEIDSGDDGVIEDGEIIQEIGIGLSDMGSRSISFSFPYAVPETSISKAEGVEFSRAEFEAGVSVKDAQGSDLHIMNWIWAADGMSARAFGFPYKALLTVEAQGQSAEVQMPDNPMDFDGDGNADLLLYDRNSFMAYALLGSQLMPRSERPYDVPLYKIPEDFGDVWEFKAETSKNRGFVFLGDLDGDGIGSATLMDDVNAVTYFWHGYDDVEPDESLKVYGKISDPSSGVGDPNGDGKVDIMMRDAQVNENGEVILDENGEPLPAFYFIFGGTTIGTGKYPWEVADKALAFDLTDLDRPCGSAIGNFDGDVKEVDGKRYPLGDIAACLKFVDSSKNRWEEIVIVYGDDASGLLDQTYTIVNSSEMVLSRIAAGDFNGDGVTDFASVLVDLEFGNESDVMVLFNEKGMREDLELVGSSQIVVEYDVNAKNVEAMVPGDVNGDGHDDLIVTSVTADGLPVATVFSWNEAVGGLLPILNFRAPDGSIRVFNEVGDWNNDGYDEIPIQYLPAFGDRHIAIVKGGEFVGGNIDLKNDASALHVRIFYSP